MQQLFGKCAMFNKMTRSVITVVPGIFDVKRVDMQ